MTKRPIDDYSIELYIGEKRSGKTLSMVAETYELVKRNPDVKVYANLDLDRNKFPGFKRINKQDLENFYKDKTTFMDCIFLIDEIHILMDSRKFGRDGNQKIGYMLGQMGKRHNIFRGTTHFPHLVDFRLRCYCEKWNYIRKGLIINGNFYPVLNNNVKLSKYENSVLHIQIKPVVRKLIDFSFQYKHLLPTYVEAQKYFDMYDTEEMIT